MSRNRGAKGGQFERDFCRQLSKWWTYSERDDIFWRTAGSGGMATNRRRRAGKGTFGQANDIQAADPLGQPLMNAFSMELKRGYNHVNPDADFTHTGKKPSMLQQFIKQAKDGQAMSKSHWWMLVHKRDRKPIQIYMPYRFWKWAKQEGVTGRPGIRMLLISTPALNKIEKGGIVITLFHEWLETFDPQIFENFKPSFVLKKKKVKK